MNTDDKQWLAALKPGDKVMRQQACSYGPTFRVMTVTRRTPTLIICGDERYYADVSRWAGREVGKVRFRGIEPFDQAKIDEAAAECERKRLPQEIQRFDWYSLDDATMAEVKVIIDRVKASRVASARPVTPP